jgi:uncharacterized protein YjbJ (UPF0337 family)
MNEDRLKGTMDEVVGSLKQKAGKLTGNTPLQIKGIAQQVKGKLENTWGEAIHAVNEANEESRTQNGTRTIGSGPFGGAGRRQ